MQDEEVHRTATEARAGTKSHVTRYVLAVSLLLVVGAFAVILLM
jgi:hypothetical protein